jgi:hypothetical protein
MDFKGKGCFHMGGRGKRAKTVYMQIKNLVNNARRYDSGGKREDPPEVRKVSIYCDNSYQKARSVGMSFARWLTEDRGTPVFQVVSIKASDVSRYIKHRLELYHQGKLTVATIQTDLTELKKLENLVNYRFGRIDWEIPEERGKRREKWGLPIRERDKTTVQRGPAYTEKQADRIMREAELRYGRVPADALRFCRATGCRLESLVDLKEKGVMAERINLEARTVTLCEKGGKWRTVRYDVRHDVFMREIKREAKASGRTLPLFSEILPPTRERDYSTATNEELKTWKRSAARRLEGIVKEIAEENGFHGRGVHGFRKEFAVGRHAEYLREVRSLVRTGDWQRLSERFEVSEQKARDMVVSWSKAGDDKKERQRVNRALDHAARLKLSKDLGHNRVDVTYAYVPRKK